MHIQSNWKNILAEKAKLRATRRVEALKAILNYIGSVFVWACIVIGFLVIASLLAILLQP